MILRRLFVLFAFVFSSSLAQFPNLNVVSEWKELEYEFPSSEAKQAAIDSDVYIPGNGVPIDVAVHYSNNSERYINHFYF